MIQSAYDIPTDLLQEFIIQASLNTNKRLQNLWQELLERWDPPKPFVVDCGKTEEAEKLLKILLSLGFGSSPAQHQFVLITRTGAKSIESNTENLEVVTFKDAEAWTNRIDKIRKSCIN